MTMPAPLRPDGSHSKCGRTIERKIADDLIRAIYKAEGWQRGERAGFDSCVARCNSLYEITADPRRNRYVAKRICPAAIARAEPQP